MSTRKIYLRADAGYGIGYGHFIRTLALADMLKSDFDCIFFTSSPSAYQISEMKKVCPYKALKEETKFEDFLDFLTGNETVVLDNYFYTTEYQRAIKDKGCVLVCIDDIHDKHYVADLIINQGIGYTTEDYSCEEYTKFALGLQYSLLRQPFLDACNRKQNNKNSTQGLNVLVAFGGSDFLNLTSSVISEIINKKSVNKITAIIGDSYNTSNLINNPKLTYRKNLSASEIVNLFLSVDVAILPASTMMNEALACGTQIIGGYYIDNQEHDYYMFLKEKLILGVDDYTDPRAFALISKHLDNFICQNAIQITSNIPKRFIYLFKSLSV